MWCDWRSVVGIALVALVMFVGNADAGTTILRPDGAPATNWQRAVERSQVPTPEITIRISRDVEGVCGRAVAGCAATDPNIMALSPKARWWHFYHELGHYFDFTYLTGPWHDAFATLLRQPLDWRVLHSDTDTQEVFADLYRWCASGRRLRGWLWRNFAWGNGAGISLTRSQVRTGCRMFAPAEDRERAPEPHDPLSPDV